MEEEVVVLYRYNKTIHKKCCPCCEAENETDEDFCFFCGATLDSDNSSLSAPAKKADSSKKWVIGIVAAAVIIAAAAIAIIAFS